jgi:hypothetical protein
MFRSRLTVSNASNDAANDHLSSAVGSNLHNGTNSHDRCSKENCLLSSDYLADPCSCNGAEKTAYVVYGRHGAQ